MLSSYTRHALRIHCHWCRRLRHDDFDSGGPSRKAAADPHNGVRMATARHSQPGMLYLHPERARCWRLEQLSAPHHKLVAERYLRGRGDELQANRRWRG